MRQLPEGMELPQLPKRLQVLLLQSSSQIELTIAALEVGDADRVALLRERDRVVRRGAAVEL